jgi:hypothetical protein
MEVAMQEKVYVCTKYNKKSISNLLSDLSDVSSIGWYGGDKIMGYTVRHDEGFLFVTFRNGNAKYCLTHGHEKYDAELVTPNEFKSIAAELCPKEK